MNNAALLHYITTSLADYDARRHAKWELASFVSVPVHGVSPCAYHNFFYEFVLWAARETARCNVGLQGLAHILHRARAREHARARSKVEVTRPSDLH